MPNILVGMDFNIGPLSIALELFLALSNKS